MIVAIPLLGVRISPRCLFAETILVVRMEGGEILSQHNHSILAQSEDTLLDELVELGVDTLVCGGVTTEFIEDAGICGIKVINNVASELEDILQALKEGRLAPGFGLIKTENIIASAEDDKEGKGGTLS